MKQRILSGWNRLRIFRLFLGVAAIVQGGLQKETVLIILGIAVLAGAVLNVGFCGSSGCSVPGVKKTMKNE